MPPKQEYEFGEIKLTLPDEFVYIDKKGRKKKAKPITKNKQLAVKNNKKSVDIVVDKDAQYPKLNIREPERPALSRGVQSLAPQLGDIVGEQPIPSITTEKTKKKTSKELRDLPVGDIVAEQTKKRSESMRRKATPSARKGRDKAPKTITSTEGLTTQDIVDEKKDSIEQRIDERTTPSIEDVLSGVNQKNQEFSDLVKEAMKDEAEDTDVEPPEIDKEEGKEVEDEEVEDEEGEEVEDDGGEEKSRELVQIPEKELTKLRRYISNINGLNKQIREKEKLFDKETNSNKKRIIEMEIEKLESDLTSNINSIGRLRKKLGIELSNEDFIRMYGSGMRMSGGTDGYISEETDEEEEEDEDEESYDGGIRFSGGASFVDDDESDRLQRYGRSQVKFFGDGLTSSKFETARVSPEHEHLLPLEEREIPKSNQVAPSSEDDKKHMEQFLKNPSKYKKERIFFGQPNPTKLRQKMYDEAMSVINASHGGGTTVSKQEMATPPKKKRLFDVIVDKIINSKDKEDMKLAELLKDESNFPHPLSQQDKELAKKVIDYAKTITEGKDEDMRVEDIDGSGFIGDLYKKAKDKVVEIKERIRRNPVSLGLSNYCGPGTSLEGQPALSRTDAICKEHDYAYNEVGKAKQRGVAKDELARMTREADQKMLDELKKVKETSLGDKIVHFASTAGISAKVLAENLGLLDPTKFSANGRPSKKLIIQGSGYFGDLFGKLNVKVGKWLYDNVVRPYASNLWKQSKQKHLQGGDLSSILATLGRINDQIKNNPQGRL